LDNQIQNIDKAIREKFENFSPAPPPQIWDEVLKGTVAQVKPSFFSAYGKQIALAASVLLVAGLGLWWFLSDSATEENVVNATDIELIEEQSENTEQFSVTAEDSESEKSNSEITETDFTDTEIASNEGQQESLVYKTKEKIAEVNEVAEATDQNDSEELPATDGNSKTKHQIVSLKASSNAHAYAERNQEIAKLPKHNFSVISSLALSPFYLENSNSKNGSEPMPVATEIVFQEKTSNPNVGWSGGVYFTTEFMLNDFDSVQLLPTYSLNYEPTYQFSNHFFLRFGLGLSYARDRGFAKVDYLSNEVVGTYEDVYDITFDSIDGEVVPTYYTKTRDIWDSVQHLQVTEVTNKYLYVQTPLLFGYRKSETKFNWYVYGGPAFNVMVSKQIEKPQDELEEVNIIDLENNLPERSPYFLQLWLGAGIEYNVGRQTAICLEPNYRYYFNTVYENEPYKAALSSFSLRFGVVFKMK